MSCRSQGFWATVCKTVRLICYQTVVCLSVCPVCAVCLSRLFLSVLCVSLSVLSVTLVYCGKTVGRIKMKVGTQVSFGPGDFVLDGDPSPLPKKGAEAPSPIFGLSDLRMISARVRFN